MNLFQVCACYNEEQEMELSPEVATFFFRTSKTFDELMEDKFLIDTIMESVGSILNTDIHMIITEFPIDKLLSHVGFDDLLISPDAERILFQGKTNDIKYEGGN